MIVDVHTHFMNIDEDWGQQVFDDLARCRMDPARWRFSADDHLRVTQAADVAVVFGLQGRKTGWNIPNEAVAAHVARAPHRLIFFASIDPGREGFYEDLIHGHQDLKCQGVKLGPVYQGVHPLDERCYAIYKYCEQNGLPIMIHMAATFSSGVPLEYARPIHIDQVAIDFPDLKIVMAHMGHPWEGEAIAVIRHSPNVYADISALYYRPWQFYNSMRLMVEYHAEDKVLLGSDYPATTTADTITGLRNVNAILDRSGLPPVPDDIIEGIIHRNTLELLNLHVSTKSSTDL